MRIRDKGEQKYLVLQVNEVIDTAKEHKLQWKIVTFSIFIKREEKKAENYDIKKNYMENLSTLSFFFVKHTIFLLLFDIHIFVFRISKDTSNYKNSKSHSLDC